MQKSLMFMIVFVFSFAALFSQGSEIYQKGDQLMQIKQYEKAVEEYNSILSKDPKDPYALYKRGVALLYLNNFDASISDFSEAIKVNGDDPDSYNNRGLARSYKGDLKSAMEDFNKAIKLDPAFAQAFVNRGSAYIALKDFDKAIKDLDKATKLDSQNPEIFLQRARLYYIKEDFDKSIKDYNSAIALGLGNSKVYYNRANSYFKLNKLEEALNDYTKALVLDPDDLDALNNKAYVLKMMGREDEAEKDKQLLTTKRNEVFTPIDKLEFSKLTNAGQDLTIELPTGWNLIEIPKESDDVTEFVITPEIVDPNSEGIMVGVTIGILKNISKSLNIHSESEALDYWKGSVDKSNEDMLIYKVFWQRHVQLNGHATILNRTTVQATENHIPFGMYEYIIAWGDNLIYMYFQAPEANYDYFEKIYEHAYKSLQIHDTFGMHKQTD